MKAIFALILISFTCCESQLDIPGAEYANEPPRTNGLKAVVFPNSYASDNRNERAKSEANTHYDYDRSQRYGRNGEDKKCESAGENLLVSNKGWKLRASGLKKFSNSTQKATLIASPFNFVSGYAKKCSKMTQKCSNFLGVSRPWFQRKSNKPTLGVFNPRLRHLKFSVVEICRLLLKFEVSSPRFILEKI